MLNVYCRFDPKVSKVSRELQDEIVKTILKYIKPKRIILFGSRARGDSTRTSDIDLAIETEDDLLNLKEILDEEVNTLLKFDVVNLKTSPKELKKEIQKEGVVIYEQES
jgi:predicted nucleotidyltransferase